MMRQARVSLLGTRGSLRVRLSTFRDGSTLLSRPTNTIEHSLQCLQWVAHSSKTIPSPLEQKVPRSSGTTRRFLHQCHLFSRTMWYLQDIMLTQCLCTTQQGLHLELMSTFLWV